MISIYKKNTIQITNGVGSKEIEFRGLSTDTKPTQYDGKDIPNGSAFIEINTGKLFLFDLDSKTWNEVA